MEIERALTIGQMKELSQFLSYVHPVLSLYLDVGDRSLSRLLLTFRNLERQIEVEAEDVSWRGALRAEAQQVEEFLQHGYDRQGMGLALFSSSEGGLWRFWQLPVGVENRLVFVERPYLRPLIELLNQYEREAVVATDREQARFFLLHLGQIEEREVLQSQVPGQHKQGGWAQARFQRHIEDRVLQHFARVADLATQFFGQEKCSHLALGGSEENITRLRELLPAEVQSHVAGAFRVDREASPGEVMVQALSVLKEARSREEKELVEAVLTGALKGGAATLGLEDTLFALCSGRAKALAVEAGFTRPGYVCTNCRNLTSQARTGCYLCPGEMRQVQDIVDLAMQRALEVDCKLEVIRYTEDLHQAGIGALLRY